MLLEFVFQIVNEDFSKISIHTDVKIALKDVQPVILLQHVLNANLVLNSKLIPTIIVLIVNRVHKIVQDASMVIVKNAKKDFS